ncbi:MAG: hypothetical protein FWG46_05595 [Treponema sp.]|nr:hypothetical protein [Treponema sp.]
MGINLILENPVWEEEMRRFELTDRLKGGPDGVDNIPLGQLANRTAYLKTNIEQSDSNSDTHSNDSVIHVTQTNRDAWYAKADSSRISNITLTDIGWYRIATSNIGVNLNHGLFRIRAKSLLFFTFILSSI